MLPHTIILAIISTLAITSSVQSVALLATQYQVSNKRDMSSVWLAQAEAQAMVPLKRRNNAVQPAGTDMKHYRDCDDDEDEDDDDEDDDEDDEDDNDDKDEWDEGDNHGNGHHSGHHGNNDHHTDIEHGTNGRQGTMDGTHDESGTFTGTYTVTMVPGATATNTAGQPEMTGRPSTASAVNTRSGEGLALISLVLAVYFL